MELQHFFASTMREAIQQIQQTLGPDAVIFSHRQVNNGVEIEAAIDRQATMPTKSTQEKSSTPPLHRAKAGVDHYVNNATNSSNQLLNQMQDEISLLRHLLQHQLADLTWQNKQRQQPLLALLFKRLRAMGLTEQFSWTLLQDIDTAQTTETAWLQCQQLLTKKFSSIGDNMMRQGGRIALVGPTGVGKTTTIAKLAARFLRQHQPHEIGLITTDHYRIAAREQLQIYGRILNIPVHTVHNACELNNSLQSLSQCKLVLIDTAGTNTAEITSSDRLALLQHSHVNLHVSLVLAANAQYEVLKHNIEAFKATGYQSTMLTKLDETISLGPLIDNILSQHLTLSYVCQGQKVPEDIAVFNPHSLIASAVDIAMGNIETMSEADAMLDFTGDN